MTRTLQESHTALGPLLFAEYKPLTSLTFDTRHIERLQKFVRQAVPKAQTQSQGNPPVFLSTHPDSGTRIQDIQTKATELNCRNRAVTNDGFNELKRII